jgi:hypothetical protein
MIEDLWKSEMIIWKKQAFGLRLSKYYIKAITITICLFQY